MFPDMDRFLNSVDAILGLHVEPQTLSFLQISARGLIVFIAAVIMLRLADRRFLSKRSAFDAVVGFILASMLARAVNGSSSFFPTLGGGFIIIGLHRLLASLTRENHALGILIKGEASLLIENGEVKNDVMRKHNLSKHDILEDIRVNGNVDDEKRVKAAYYERNGQVSVIKD